MDLSSLNPPQRQAVLHGEGPLLLLAGAGSGKTRVITSRIAHLLLTVRIPAEQILAVTFTNKAANEMRERVVEQVGKKNSRGLTVSTFHSLGVRLLREEIERLGFKRNFSIYGAADQLHLLRDLISRVNRSDRRYDAERLQFMISEAKNRLLSPEEYHPLFHDDYGRLAKEIYPLYQQALKAFNAVDFDDILMLTVRLLETYSEVREAVRQRFRFVMVDEYQDTNAAQYRLLRLICDGHRNLCVVGDDDQSIYGWRGADPTNILDFEKDFPGAVVIKLEQNYRSTGTILAAANAVIQHNKVRRDKQLWSAGGAGEPLMRLRCEDEEDEARAVVERMQTLRFRDQVPWRDFAILYRTNVQSRSFEEQLRYENIPYVLIGGQQFFDRKEVRDVLAYLRVLVNPADEVNLLRILNYPKRGIGETSADRLIRHSAASGEPLWEVLATAHHVEDLGEKSLEAIGRFVTLCDSYRERFRRSRNLAGVGSELLDEIGLAEEIYRSVDDPQKARRRIENMEEVINALASYEEREVVPTLGGFLERVALLDRDTPGRGKKEEKLSRDAVVLMSLHSSKGLEFPHVFFVGMEEGYLPHSKSVSEGGGIDEERRLCYVGITRAMCTLTLSTAARRKKFGKAEQRTVSPFLGEIPDELLQEQDSRVTVDNGGEQAAANFFSGIQALLGKDEE